jgi:hypothetical protein
MTTTVNKNAPFAKKLFSVGLTALVTREPTDMSLLCGPAPNQKEAEANLKLQSSPGMPGIWVKDLTKDGDKTGGGDRVTIEAFDTLKGRPIMGDKNREGRGESGRISSMEARIDLSSKVAQGKPGTMSQKRTSIDLESVAMANLRGYFPKLISNRAMIQVAGARGSQKSDLWMVPMQNDPEFDEIMINPVKAPTYNRHFVVDSSDGLKKGGANVNNVDSTDIWTLDTIDELSERLDSMEFPLGNLRLKDDAAFHSDPIKGVLYLDPQQFAQLIRGNPANANTIRNWQATAQERAKYTQKSPLFSGEVYMWNNILIRKMPASIYFNPNESMKVVTEGDRYTAAETSVVVSPGLGAGYRVSRAILMGAQAFAMIMGNNASANNSAINVERRLFDFGKKSELMVEWIGGETKLRFEFLNSAGVKEPTDYGVVAIDSVVRAIAQ